MENLILQTIKKRFKQLEMECLMNLIALKALGPDEPVPLFDLEELENKAIDYLVKNQIIPEQKKYLSIKEAMDILKVSRTTLATLRNEGLLTTYEHRRNIYLCRLEVKELLKTYSKMKGKV